MTTRLRETTISQAPLGDAFAYIADFTFKCIARFFTPFMGRKLDDVGSKAVAGLAAVLREREPTNGS